MEENDIYTNTIKLLNQIIREEHSVCMEYEPFISKYKKLINSYRFFQTYKNQNNTTSIKNLGVIACKLNTLIESTESKLYGK